MAIPKPNIVTAAKAKTIRPAVYAELLAAANPTTAMPVNPAQNQGIQSSSSSNANPRPGFEGPSLNIPDVSQPGADSYVPKTDADKQASSNQALGRVSKADAMKQLAGMGTADPRLPSRKRTNSRI